MNSTNCEAIISVWSGGGQLASYCSNSKLIMYFHKYQMQYNIGNDELNTYIKSENASDFCQFTNAKRYFLNSNNINEIKNILIK